eukprot:TRINITY_DN5221_c0_g1_i1.p1 TRINITY_DN5221_c0_g1~~TRINITY_DN5221_c0_g1_i1.p1  ORF type:complete len:221 (+),score=31.89 TRINITY_DN5221_c0_g1_i1:250-912(+)
MEPINVKEYNSRSCEVRTRSWGVVGVSEVPHHGRTDREIIIDMLKIKGVEWNPSMLKNIIHEVAKYEPEAGVSWGDGLEVLPGVRELLSRLCEMPDVTIGLVTGNVEAIAWKKLDALKLSQYFKTRFGGFGGDFNTRRECLQFAKSQYPQATRLFHFGDAPADMDAAAHNKVTPVGVLTGIFNIDQLTEAVGSNGGSPIIFEDLSNTKAVLSRLALSSKL